MFEKLKVNFFVSIVIGIVTMYLTKDMNNPAFCTKDDDEPVAALLSFFPDVPKHNPNIPLPTSNVVRSNVNVNHKQTEEVLNDVLERIRVKTHLNEINQIVQEMEVITEQRKAINQQVGAINQQAKALNQQAEVINEQAKVINNQVLQKVGKLNVILNDIVEEVKEKESKTKELKPIENRGISKSWLGLGLGAIYVLHKVYKG